MNEDLFLRCLQKYEADIRLLPKVAINMFDTNSPGYKVFWRGREGKVEVAQMDDSYLINTLRYCIVNNEATKFSHIPELAIINGKSFEEWIYIFTSEYDYRKEKAKKQEIEKLQQEYDELQSREERREKVANRLRELGVKV